MPDIRNTSGVSRSVPWLGRLVLDEQTVSVPAEQVTAFTQQLETWAPADAEAEALHKQMLDGVADYIASLNPAAEVVEDSSASELIATICGMDADQVAALIEAEQARPKPRKTVLKAADDRLAEFDPIDDPDTASGAGNDPQEG